MYHVLTLMLDYAWLPNQPNEKMITRIIPRNVILAKIKYPNQHAAPMMSYC